MTDVEKITVPTAQLISMIQIIYRDDVGLSSQDAFHKAKLRVAGLTQSTSLIRARLSLIKHGVPFDMAMNLDKAILNAFVIGFAQLDGYAFNFDTEKFEV